MADIDYPKLAQGEAKLATEQDIQKDLMGITNPNLHRRIDDDLSFISAEGHLATAEEDAIIGTNEDEAIVFPIRIEGGKADYTISVSGVNSFRTTNHITHDEDSITEEIP